VPSVAARGEYQQGMKSVEVHPAVAPTDNEAVIMKRRISAFFATELDMILRCFQAQTIVIAGLITSGAVLSTVRQAMDLDYRVTVIEDLCMDRDEEVHRVLIDKVFARKTEIVSAVNWILEIGN
jgi:nicotinamidase-related amidase